MLVVNGSYTCFSVRDLQLPSFSFKSSEYRLVKTLFYLLNLFLIFINFSVFLLQNVGVYVGYVEDCMNGWMDMRMDKNKIKCMNRK